MQKFFSLVCAVLLVFSASAAPVAQKAQLVKKAPVAVEQMQKVQFEQAQIANFNQFSAAPALKVINQKPQAPAVKPAARKLATAEPIVVIIDGTPSIQPVGDAQAISVIGKDNMVYAWGVKATSLEAGKTYAFTDMDIDYTYRCSQDYMTTWEDPTDATFSIDAENNITASMVTESGTYMVYTKAPQPEPVEITLVSDTLNFFTKMLSTGYYIVRGYNVDSTYEFSFYFNSKSITGNFTEEDFYTYDTWVDEKDGKKIVVSYQNLSAANVTVSLVKDTLYYTGTMTLATNDGQEAIVTLNLSCPYKQEWGEWTDFAPFEFNTGKYTFATFGAYTQTGIEVLERKDNTGLKQYKLKNWSKGYFDGVGQDLILNMNPDHTFTFASNPINLGADVYFADVATAYNNPAYASYNSYDPETGVFSFYTAVVLASSGSVYTAAEESLVMDRPILERDTVDIVSTALKYNDLIASNKVVIYYATDVPDYYLFRVTSNNATAVDGTFKWSDGTINDPNSYFSVSGTDKNYFQDGEFTVVTNDKDIALTGWMIGVDEKYYRLDMSYTAPTERDTVRFSGQGVTISECVNSQTGVQTGWFYELTDASTGYRFMLQSTVVANKYGTFSYEDKTLGSNYYNVFDPQGNRQQFVEGSITVGEVGDSLILDGELIAEDEKVYVLHFAQSAKVLNYDTDAPFDATFAWSDMDASITDGVIGIYATNAEGRTIGLKLYADPAATEIPEGVYTISDTQEAGTALQSLGVAGGYLTECYAGTLAASGGIDDCWFIVEGTITLSYDEYGKLKVVVDGKNSYDQPVTALVQYEKLEPKSTVDIVSTNLSYTDEWYAQYGIQEFVLTNDNYGVLLDIFADTLVGEFTEDDVDLADSYIVDFNTGVKIPVVNTGNIVVTLDGKNLALTATLIGADTIQYNISATGYLGYIQGDAIDAYEGEFAVKNVTFAQYSKSQIALSASNEVGDTVTIVVKGELKNAVLPAGEYSRVMASTGFTAEYDVYPSFVGNNAGVWFIQSGKLTVAEDGSMLFEGLNSYDKDVTIKFIASHPTDLININAAVKATKVVRNGRMMVIKDAKVYSVLGQQIQ